MKMDIVASSKNDEFYTPPQAIIPLLEFVVEGTTCWCPFDTEESYFVKILRAYGCKVIATHIDNGEDFFAFTPDEYYSYIISNPPYSKRTEVLERLFSLGTPFAMLVGIVGLFESKRRFDLFSKNQFEIMYLNKRISFFKSYSDQRPSINPPFSTVYVTSKMLPRQIIFKEL